jgi:DNA-binding GntR family transcriptional regulator
MRKSKSGIPNEILKEIFPQKLTRFQFPDRAYGQLQKRILSGKLKKGQRLSYDGIVRDFNTSRRAAHKVISQLKKDGLSVSKDKRGSFVV